MARAEGAAQAAELLAELDEDVDDEEADDVDVVVDDFASDDFVSDEPLAFDAGLLLDVAPRESLR
jgi:hypothetical protein